MSTQFDADAFARHKLVLNGAEYYFRPATIRDQIDYLEAQIVPAITAATDIKERNKILIEVIRKYIPDLSEEALYDVTLEQLWSIYAYVINGIPPLDQEKN